MQKEFEAARIIYPGTKRGLETEYSNFIYRCKNPLGGMPKIVPGAIIGRLVSAIELQIAVRDMLRDRNQFVAPWKHFQTWINNRCWEEVVDLPKKTKTGCRAVGCNAEWVGTHEHKPFCKKHLVEIRGY